jgi:hypothetical protein
MRELLKYQTVPNMRNKNKTKALPLRRLWVCSSTSGRACSSSWVGSGDSIMVEGMITLSKGEPYVYQEEGAMRRFFDGP